MAPGTLYVKKGNASAAFPYDEEETASATLADALAAAGEGSTIWLLPSEATDPDLDARSVGKTVTIAGKTGNPEDVVIKGCMNLAYPGVRLYGVTVYGAKEGAANVLISGEGCVVSNCVIRDHVAGNGYSNPAVMVTGAKTFITHCVIRDNPLGSQAFNGDYAQPAGLRLGGSGSVCANTLLARNITQAAN